VNITYKVLYNDAVAMTGGQQVGERPEGHSVLQIQKSLVAEGVAKLVIVTDEPQKYDGVALETGVAVHHRDELDRIQREFREIPGCTAIIYDQTCATEKRRRRKRGKLATPAKTVVINELVCEGCGDCSVQSNCLSVEPLETEFGRKRRINQNSCNKDFSCVKGFCPSFVTVEGGELKKPKKVRKGDLSALPNIPEPVLPVAEEAWGILVAGVGGTGVITIGQLLGMAAHLEGKGIVTQDAAGLAQKGGSTWSHVQIANRPEAIHTTKIDTAKADLVIACDAIVGASKYTTGLIREGHTFVALNTHGTPTAAFTRNPDWQFPGGNREAALVAAAGAEMVGSFDAEQAAVQLLGDSIYTNPLMLGYTWQMGRVPLSHAALMRAMELNGVQIENNKAAFEWGRRCAHDLKAVQALFQAAAVIEIVRRPSLDQVIRKRVEFLTDYQNAAYAANYQAFLERVRSSEARLKSTPRVTIVVAPIELGLCGSRLTDGGRGLWSLWAKAGAVGNADALSTASWPVREAHRPQIHSPLPAPQAPAPLAACFFNGGDSCENELARYGKKFKDGAVARLLPPESAAAEVVAREIGVSVDTLERWRSEALAEPARERVWTAAARLEAVIATAAMNEAARSAWCRANGVYPQELAQWRQAATAALATPQEASAAPQAKQDRRRIKELEREVRRKDKALAVEIASIPEEIRGYDHVKARHLTAARAKWAALRSQWRNGTAVKQVA